MLPDSTNPTGLTRLERAVERGFETVNSRLDGLDHRLRNLENNEASRGGTTELRLTGLERGVGEACVRLAQLETNLSERIEDYKVDHAAELKVLASRLDTIEPWVRGAKWVVGVLGTSLLALIWSLITGQVQLLFK
jgi:hypothetical protein